ncbi:MAG: glycosyltransferase family 4 protein [Ferruginibacter sp.]
MTNILFLTLKVFSATGGIEKVCRIASKSLYEYGLENHKKVSISSLHDPAKSAFLNNYFPRNIFKGYGVNKAGFISNAVMKGREAEVVLLSHINLLPVGWLIKKLSPNTKLILIAHGIEIWSPLKSYVLKMLKCCDKILAVSEFTRGKIIETHNFPAEKCLVLNNCLDPFLPLPKKMSDTELRKRYGFTSEDKIIFTLTRISTEERYKGYDKVIEALALLQNDHPLAKYLISGSYDKIEKAKIDELIIKLGLTGRVVLSGFISEEELSAHFNMADVYIMPSKKEGFGLVFIEAMYYSLPVIAGNVDGSRDALLNGELGMLVNPDSIEEIKEALEKVISGKNSFIPNRELLINNFGYEAYKRNIENAIFNLN